MFAFYNPETNKYMHYYPYYDSWGESVEHTLDRDSTEIVFVHQNRTVLENILSNYHQCNFGDGSNITSIEVEHGFLDGFEIVELKHA